MLGVVSCAIDTDEKHTWSSSQLKEFHYLKISTPRFTFEDKTLFSSCCDELWPAVGKQSAFLGAVKSFFSFLMFFSNHTFMF